ncbi:hypothetical protein AAU61_13755 [Desulfocarbo indianensis]|nr:hypothetical protein AAU61_13755 [Desulfocarbo indianensis]
MNGNYEAALRKLGKACASGERQGRIFLLLAKVQIAVGRYDEALAILQRIIEKGDDNKNQAHLLAARVFAEKNNTDLALHHWQAVEAEYPAISLRGQVATLSRAERHEEVMAIARRVAKASPPLNAEARQEILYAGGRAAYHNQEYEASLRMLGQAYDAAPSGALAPEIKAWRHDVAEIDRPWWLGAQTGFLYDSNVYLDPIFQDPAHAVASGKSDSAFLAEAWGGGRAWRGENGLELGFTGKAQTVAFFQQTEASSSYWAPGAYLGWGKAAWGFRVPYQFYYYYRGARKDDWSRMHSLTPYLYWQMTKSFKTFFSLILFERQYFDGRSGSLHGGLAVDHILTFARKDDYIRLGYRVDQEDAYDDISGYRGYEATLGAGCLLLEGLKLEADLTWAHYDYDPRQEWTLAYEPFERKDEQMRLTVQLIQRLPGWWRLTLSYYYINNDSNVEGPGISPYDYYKNVASFMVTKYF